MNRIILICTLCLTIPWIYLSEAVAQSQSRTLREDARTAFGRVPRIFKSQWISQEGVFINFLSLPLVGASFYEERKVSDFFRDNQIKEDSAVDTALDHTGSRLYPFFFIPMYAIARAVKSDPLADLSLDFATYAMIIYPEILTLRFIGDRPRPNGSKDFSFGMKTPSSFPSGHVGIAVGVARLVDYHFGHLIGIPLYMVAAAIAYQRLGEGEHYLADVLGGAFLGFGIAEAIVRDRERERAGEEESDKSGLSLSPLLGGPWGASGLLVTWSF